MNEDLSLVATEDLIAELEKRSQAIVVAWCKDHDGVGEDEREVREYACHGDVLKCIGLATWATQMISRDAMPEDDEYIS